MLLCLLVASVLAAPPHYGKPPCLSDEKALEIKGVQGVVCGASCDDRACPTDVPTNVTATPKCALSSGLDTYCALLCNPSKKECGAATCKPFGDDEGVCTYP